MGTFAETANVDYCLSVYRLPTKENQIPCSVFRSQKINRILPFQFAANKQKLAFSVISIFHIYIYVCVWVWGGVCVLPIQRQNYKMEAQAIFLSPFTVCSSCKQKLSACPSMVKSKVWSRLLYPPPPSADPFPLLPCFGVTCYGREKGNLTPNQSFSQGKREILEGKAPRLENATKCIE
jgi:hypothetical protein